MFTSTCLEQGLAFALPLYAQRHAASPLPAPSAAALPFVLACLAAAAAALPALSFLRVLGPCGVLTVGGCWVLGRDAAFGPAALWAGAGMVGLG
eukprot:gene36595-1270_t